MLLCFTFVSEKKRQGTKMLRSFHGQTLILFKTSSLCHQHEMLLSNVVYFHGFGDFDYPYLYIACRWYYNRKTILCSHFLLANGVLAQPIITASAITGKMKRQWSVIETCLWTDIDSVCHVLHCTPAVQRISGLSPFNVVVVTSTLLLPK